MCTQVDNFSYVNLDLSHLSNMTGRECVKYVSDEESDLSNNVTLCPAWSQLRAVN